ncbi:hypothetical protein HMPREF2698_04215 [Corynebacterium sp. HMSC072A02]|nr:hypothetical protein HMPREF2698_04215 [Corynebacterium sp. HMSC072A02]
MLSVEDSDSVTVVASELSVPSGSVSEGDTVVVTVLVTHCSVLVGVVEEDSVEDSSVVGDGSAEEDVTEDDGTTKEDTELDDELDEDDEDSVVGDGSAEEDVTEDDGTTEEDTELDDELDEDSVVGDGSGVGSSSTVRVVLAVACLNNGELWLSTFAPKCSLSGSKLQVLERTSCSM